MDIYDLIDKLEEISMKNETDCPKIYIQIGNTQAPLLEVQYFPENATNYESIVLSCNKKPKYIL